MITIKEFFALTRDIRFAPLTQRFVHPVPSLIRYSAAHGAASPADLDVVFHLDKPWESRRISINSLDADHHVVFDPMVSNLWDAMQQGLYAPLEDKSAPTYELLRQLHRSVIRSPKKSVRVLAESDTPYAQVALDSDYGVLFRVQPRTRYETLPMIPQGAYSLVLEQATGLVPQFIEACRVREAAAAEEAERQKQEHLEDRSYADSRRESVMSAIELLEEYRNA